MSDDRWTGDDTFAESEIVFVSVSKTETDVFIANVRHSRCYLSIVIYVCAAFLF